VPYLSALEMSHDKALYKCTDTLLYYATLTIAMMPIWSFTLLREMTSRGLF